MTVASGTTEECPILLLKTRSIPTDSYEDFFNDANHGRFKPSFVPVLEHRYKQDTLVWLRSMIESGGLSLGQSETSQQRGDFVFSGMIFTSQRAVEAFAEVVSSLDETSKHDLLPANLPLYVVGPATAKGLRSLNLGCQILGEESGNGETLAQYILSHHSPEHMRGVRESIRKAPLLFMVGEQRRDIIPNTLQSLDLPTNERIGVVEKVIYETGEMESFSSDLRAILKANAASNTSKQWIVVFSPTGCKAMLKCLGWLDKSTGRCNGLEVENAEPATYIATIGPTTRDYLKKEFAFEPHVCAEKPSAEGIAAGIEDFTTGHAGR